MYYKGEGVQQDYKQALTWYEMAADSGDEDSQMVLGNAYNKGTGVPLSRGDAFKWYRKAAEQGNADAQFAIGVFYSQGISTSSGLIDVENMPDEASSLDVFLHPVELC